MMTTSREMIKVETSRPQQIKLMRAMFKLGLLVDLFDDIAISNSTLIRQKDKAIVKQFQNHMKSKFKETVEGLFDLEVKTDYDILDPMKQEIEAIMDRVLNEDLTFDKADGAIS